ncbi:MAG: hypothetical protein M1833_002790 [Piccolia ochrophora]|nr:MAG: hypothetical protein M1833_002790 [Piccolia ochrophora]
MRQIMLQLKLRRIAGLLYSTSLLDISRVPPLAAAQSTQLLDFSPGALPACAQACTPLYSAQGACVAVPGGAATPDPKACFCQSAYLQSLYSTQAGLCDTACPPDALGQIRTWFNAQCPRAAAQPGPGGSTTSSSAPPPGGATAKAGETPTSTSGAIVTSSDSSGSWWSSHWRWVLMLIIIFIAVVVATVGGVMFKRHRRRKAAAAAAGMTEPVAWGPHQHQHFTHGYTYSPGPRGEAGRSSSTRGKARETRPVSSGPHRLRESLRS